MAFRGIQQRLRANDICGQEDLGLHNAAVYMALRREMDDGIKIIVREQPLHQISVPDVPLDKPVAGIALHCL